MNSPVADAGKYNLLCSVAIKKMLKKEKNILFKECVEHNSEANKAIKALKKCGYDPNLMHYYKRKETVVEDYLKNFRNSLKCWAILIAYNDLKYGNVAEKYIKNVYVFANEDCKIEIYDNVVSLNNFEESEKFLRAQNLINFSPKYMLFNLAYNSYLYLSVRFEDIKDDRDKKMKEWISD